MLSRVLSPGIAVVIATTGLTFSAAAERVGGGAGAEELLLAQAGYDPMRRANPSEVPTRPEANPELGGLPDAPGAEETFYLCSACHSIALVKQQRLTDERWDYLWTWMTTEQGMPEQDEETRVLILAYLKEFFSSER